MTSTSGSISGSQVALTEPSMPASASSPARLRIWPAAILLLVLVLCRLAAFMTEEMSFGLFMLSVYGPMACTLGTGIWWLFASRATRKERWLGLLLLLAIVIVSNLLADKSMHGMGYFFFALPVGLAALLIGWLVLSRVRSPARTYGALFAALLGFGYWDLVRSEGVTGDFKAKLSWRWEPTPEDRFLADLRSSPAENPVAQQQRAEPLGEILWSQFRGANRDGVVAGVVLDSDWKSHPPRAIWRHPVGPGWSSFSVAGDRLFTQEQRGEAEAVVCLDANSGQTMWVREAPARFWEMVAGAGPRATPTLSGDGLFTLGATGLLQRLDPLTGAVVWKRDLKQDSGREPPTWGFSSSPLVIAETVIVHAGGKEDKGVLAYSATDGEPLWSTAAGDHSYSSPQWSNIAGRDQVLMLTNAGLQGIDHANGALLWKYDWVFPGYRVVQPLVVGTSRVLLGTGMGMGTRLVEVSPEEDAVTFHEQWTSLQIKPDFNDYVAHQGNLYGFDHNIFTCIDLETGKRRWKQGRYGTGQVLLLVDADQLLVISEGGEIVLLAANPDRPEELARWKALEGKTWNHPVLVKNRLYIRNSEEAACLELPLKENNSTSSK